MDEPECKPAHERKRGLCLEEVFGEDSVYPYVKLSASGRKFAVQQGVDTGSQKHFRTHIEVKSPDAAREMAAHLVAWAEYVEADDD